MRLFNISALLLLAAITAVGAHGPFSGPPDPTFYSVFDCLENTARAGRCGPFPTPYQLRDIDFRNFSIHLAGEIKEIPLSNGHYEKSGDLGTENADLIGLHYLDHNATG